MEADARYPLPIRAGASFVGTISRFDASVEEGQIPVTVRLLSLSRAASGKASHHRQAGDCTAGQSAWNASE